jgi:hypothetical protein
LANTPWTPTSPPHASASNPPTPSTPDHALIPSSWLLPPASDPLLPKFPAAPLRTSDAKPTAKNGIYILDSLNRLAAFRPGLNRRFETWIVWGHSRPTIEQLGVACLTQPRSERGYRCLGEPFARHARLLRRN